MSKDYIAISAQYQADVLSGVIPACRWVRLACERNRRDLDRQETEAFPFRFDPAAGRRICAFAELLPHIKGPKALIIGRDEEDRPIWNPIQLEPWQCWFYTTLFGWVHADSGLRRFRVSLALIPRKNAKSTMAAIVVLYMLCATGEGGPECYSVAKTRDQAKTVAEIVWQMAKRSPQLCEFYGVRTGSETTMSLAIPERAGKFLALSSDEKSLDGLNVYLAVIDELHAHPTAGVWNVMDTGTGARLEPQLFAITTAGVDIGGICHQKLAYLEKILDGTAIDEAFFGINYTIDPGDDIRDPVVQRKANPNYGVSVQPDDLIRKIGEAQHSTAALNNILTKHFNIWIRTESSWMSGTLWRTCAKAAWANLSAAERYAAAIAEWKAFPCWIGVDLAEVRDIAALMAIFKLSEETYGAIGRFYLPASTVDKSPIAELPGWVRDGFIIETPGDQADFLRIEDDIVAWQSVLNVQEIDFDRALASQMQQSLKRRFEPKMGKDAVERLVVTVPQDTPTMDAAMKMTERLVLSKKIEHDGNPAMAWMISNVVVKRADSNDEIRPSKAGGKDSANKIDGPVAMFTALSQAMRGSAAPPAFQMFFSGGQK